MTERDSRLRIYDGFHMDESINVLNNVSLSSDDPWDIYFYILRMCRRGIFDELGRLTYLMAHSDSYFFWRATSELVGYAGNWKLISELFSSFEAQWTDSGVQYSLAVTLGASCNLNAVTPLLKLHEVAEDEEARHQVENHLSFLLEKENGGVWDGASQTLDVPDDHDAPLRFIIDRESYFEIVRKAFRELNVTQSHGPRPVYEGRVYDIVQLSRRLLKRLRSDDPPSGRINRERVAFEAATGLDTRPFYNENGTLLRLPAAAIVEGFLDSDDVNRFRPGQRYFFGHPIPE